VGLSLQRKMSLSGNGTGSLLEKGLYDSIQYYVWWLMTKYGEENRQTLTCLTLPKQSSDLG
jgi:hypothetical protein